MTRLQVRDEFRCCQMPVAKNIIAIYTTCKIKSCYTIPVYLLRLAYINIPLSFCWIFIAVVLSQVLRQTTLESVHFTLTSYRSYPFGTACWLWFSIVELCKGLLCFT